MDYLIEHDPLEHAHLVTASGELDVAAAPQLSAILTMGAASSQSVVVLDMSGATFIDSTALGVVIRAADQLIAAGKRLFIVSPEGPVSRLLELTNLKQHFSVYSDREDAISAASQYLICEALTNTAKHATHAGIAVRRENGHVVVEVGDDGVGGADAGGSGMRGLNDRIEALDGTLTVSSPPGAGTRLRAEIPCGQA